MKSFQQHANLCCHWLLVSYLLGHFWTKIPLWGSCVVARCLSTLQAYGIDLHSKRSDFASFTPAVPTSPGWTFTSPHASHNSILNPTGFNPDNTTSLKQVDDHEEKGGKRNMQKGQTLSKRGKH